MKEDFVFMFINIIHQKNPESSMNICVFDTDLSSSVHIENLSAREKKMND